MRGLRSQSNKDAQRLTKRMDHATMAVYLHRQRCHHTKPVSGGWAEGADIMNTATANKGRMNQERYEDLRRMLEDRRREIMSEVQEKIRDVRSENAFGKV